ncbi:MAG: hypothetical protein B5766_04640 [Candidatus Lumbricidophila eiseniae]|uniref:Uncharacterized protein n=1 Tax=Candidatus Lumbricidiphila eiseniae TaxID=1969409 RepID=A0A2A6FT01_9MICO|nr:MAG: hypothetical protein B5766_04640 [Candidatus Lumbricidophila eiseniae]
MEDDGCGVTCSAGNQRDGAVLGKTVCSAVFVVLLAVGLVACSSEEGESAGSSTSEMVVKISPDPEVPDPPAVIPEFTGPWADEFAEFYRKTTSDLVRQILAKGHITDQDFAQTESLYRKCMLNEGFLDEGRGAKPLNHATAEMSIDQIQQVWKRCDQDHSLISTLRYDMARNPQHLNEDEIMVACLVKKKLVPASYTAKDYRHDWETNAHDADSPAFHECSLDPLGLGYG